MILATRLHESQATVLGLDIGTNTEIVLARDGRMISCSCPSGPAFEGAHIYHGMRAVEGAISRIQLIEGGQKVNYETIGNRPALACAVQGFSTLWRNWCVMGSSAIMVSCEHSHPRVRDSGDGEGREFLLVPAEETGLDHDLVLTQKDIGEIQLAKAAIAERD